MIYSQYAWITIYPRLGTTWKNASILPPLPVLDILVLNNNMECELEEKRMFSTYALTGGGAGNKQGRDAGGRRQRTTPRILLLLLCEINHSLHSGPLQTDAVVAARMKISPADYRLLSSSSSLDCAIVQKRCCCS